MAQVITKWEGGTDEVVFSWKSKLFVLPSRKTFTAAKVIADDYPVYFELFTDGQMRYACRVDSRSAFRLPSGYECEEVEVRITGKSKIQSAFVAESMDELRQT